MRGLRSSTMIAAAAAVAMAATHTAAQDVSLADVLARAEQYVTQYERTFSVLVAEEDYLQEIRWPPAMRAGVRESRTLRSDYLLVKLNAGSGWMPFRDVFDVNGRRVRDREDRLARLFMAPPTNTAIDQAALIMADSTRYNLGGVTRTINIPTLALQFLHPALRPRFRFTHKGSEVVADHQAWALDFKETGRPTLIKTSNGRDLALTGRVWVNPHTGVVVKTRLTAADPTVRANVTVTFRDDANLTLWVPAQMEEYYRAARDPNEVHGLATYSNYRRFTVSTDESVRKPPGGLLSR